MIFRKYRPVKLSSQRRNENRGYFRFYADRLPASIGTKITAILSTWNRCLTESSDSVKHLFQVYVIQKFYRDTTRKLKVKHFI